MTSYGLTITDKACEKITSRPCDTYPGSRCAGCNGDGTRTVPLDRDATPLADAVRALLTAQRDDPADIFAAERDLVFAALALFPKEDNPDE